MRLPLQIIEASTYTKQNICDNTLVDANLETRCPLDNGRHSDVSPNVFCAIGQLDQLPAELLVQVMLHVDIPSLTAFRRVNRRAMELVNSVPQYAAVIKHCPDIIRAILSIQASSFDCGTLYRTLSTTRCATCPRFGDHLYLISCLRVCYFCFTRRREYFALSTGQTMKLFKSTTEERRKGLTAQKLLYRANIPMALSLPGTYSNAGYRGGLSIRKRLQLFDRQAFQTDSTVIEAIESDKTTREPRRFMAIITAPYLRSAGQSVNWGYFCLGCKDMYDNLDCLHYRNKYTKESIVEHFARYGPVEKKPRYSSFIHIALT